MKCVDTQETGGTSYWCLHGLTGVAPGATSTVAKGIQAKRRPLTLDGYP
jgi:hypothetical protein